MKARLYGSHLQRLDEKARLSVPAKLVAALRELAGIGATDPLEVVISVTHRNRLGIFPRPRFESLIAAAEEAQEESLEAEELLATYLNYMDEQTLDKQNRIRVPAMHAELFNLSEKVVVMGSGDYIEVVSPENWKDQAQGNMSRIQVNRAKLKRQAAGDSEE